MNTKAGGTQSVAPLWLTSSSDEVAPLNKKVIHPGTKVFFRWINRTEFLGSSADAQKKLLKQFQQNAKKDGAQWDLTDERTAPFGDAIAFFDSPLHINSDGLFSALIILLSLIGLVLVLLLGYFLVRLFQGGDDHDNSMRRQEEGSPRHLRELQVVLVPKKGRRKSSLTAALIHPFRLGDKKHLIERKETVAGFCHQSTNGTARPFPKRIYELQAEEGYFSCPHSMRASFELD